MRLVFVHGIHEEHKAPAALRQAWEDALLSAWDTAGLAKPNYTLAMPYFGDLLAELTCDVVRALMSSSPGITRRIEQALIRDIGKAVGVDEGKSNDEFADGLVRSDFAEREWVQGVFRFLERDIPGFGLFLLSFTRQVDAYLTSPTIRAAIDNVVRPALLDGPTVVVAHSLGSIIAYRLLREAQPNAEVPLFVTLGSPLGINVIKNRLNPPSLAVPRSVRAWLNATDERDCVALHARLDRLTFVDGIENVADVCHGQDNPHAIADYLGHATVAQRIRAALSRGATSTRRERVSGCHGPAASPRTAAPPRRIPV